MITSKELESVDAELLVVVEREIEGCAIVIVKPFVQFVGRGFFIGIVAEILQKGLFISIVGYVSKFSTQHQIVEQLIVKTKVSSDFAVFFLQGFVSF